MCVWPSVCLACVCDHGFSGSGGRDEGGVSGSGFVYLAVPPSVYSMFVFIIVFFFFILSSGTEW